MSTGVSGLERVGESTATLREAVAAAEKTTAFEILLGGVLSDAQEHGTDENRYEGPVQQSSVRRTDDSKKESGEDVSVSSTEKSERIGQSLVSVYAYESVQPVFTVDDYSGAVKEQQPEERTSDAAADKAPTRSAEEPAEKNITDAAADTRTEKNDQTEEAKKTAEDGKTDSEAEEVETEEEPVDADAEVVEEADAELIEEPVSAVEKEAPAEEGDGDAVLQPVAVEEEDAVEVEDGDLAQDGEDGEQAVGLTERGANSEEPPEEGQEGSEEQSRQAGSAHAAEMTAQGSSARVAEGDSLSSDFLSEMMQQSEVPSASAGSETLARIEQIQQLVDRFDQHILSMIRSSNQDMTITISPESLGKLVVHCHEEADGVRVHVHAENASVCNLLQQQESGIRQALNQNGYKLAEFDVSTENGESAEQRRERMMNEREEEQRDLQGGGRGTRGEGKEAAPARTAQRMDRNGVWLIA